MNSKVANKVRTKAVVSFVALSVLMSPASCLANGLQPDSNSVPLLNRATDLCSPLSLPDTLPGIVPAQKPVALVAPIPGAAAEQTTTTVETLTDVTHGDTTQSNVSLPPNAAEVPEEAPVTETVKTTDAGRILTSPEGVELQLEVSRNSLVAPQQRLEDLVKAALERDTKNQMLTKKANAKFGGAKKVARRMKAMAQFATAYQGFESSSEAADVILDEKVKLKHHHAVEYVRQRELDELHIRLFQAMLQVAQGLGIKDNPERSNKMIAAGRAELELLAGPEEAEKTVSLLTAWSNRLHIPDEAYARDPWDVMETQKKSAEVLRSALRDDSVLRAIEERLHKFNSHSNFMRASAKIIQTGLSIAMLTPSFVSPAAQLAQLVFIALTGGPEEEKLLKEVYLDKCFESRFKRLSGEAQLVVNNYNMALVTKNPALLGCSEALLTQLVGEPGLKNIVGVTVLPASEKAPLVEVTLKKSKDAAPNSADNAAPVKINEKPKKQKSARKYKSRTL